MTGTPRHASRLRRRTDSLVEGGDYDKVSRLDGEEAEEDPQPSQLSWVRRIVFAAFLLLLLLLAGAAASADIFSSMIDRGSGVNCSPGTAKGRLRLFSATRFPHARCMDGSPSGVYIIPRISPSPSRRFALYLQSGGWCIDDASCNARCGGRDISSGRCQSRLASSAPWDAEGCFGGLLSDDSAISPLHDATKVYLAYCTSDAHMGDRGTVSSSQYQFHGQRTVEAALAVMVSELGLGSEPGQTLIFGGGSAGSRGAMVTLDFVQGILTSMSGDGYTHSALLLGFLDSPYYIDAAPLSGVPFVGFAAECRDVYAQAATSARAPADCLAARSSSEAWQCIMGQYRMPFLHVPFMIVASSADSYQLGRNLGGWSGGMTSADLAYAAQFQAATRNGLAALAADPATPAGSVIFSQACADHSVSLTGKFATVAAAGVTMKDAFENFLRVNEAAAAGGGGGGGGVTSYVDGCSGFACGSGCD
jgi:hypothetical protein